MSRDVTVPDIGDFTDVPVIELLVAVGDVLAAEDPLVVLESDKATFEVPSPFAGTVEELLVGVGDRVAQGTVLARLTDAPVDDAPAEATPAPAAPPAPAPAAAPEPAPEPAPEAAQDADESCELLVLGGGPGGYTAAFRAADLGLDVVLVERDPMLGGVCLNVGCIPSKALLHVAKAMAEAQASAVHGVTFVAPQIDLDALRAHKDDVVGKLVGGLGGLAKARGVRVVHGEGRFTGPHRLDVGDSSFAFEQAIVATGSRPVRLPGFPHDDPRVMDSTGALALADIPDRLLVVGGGIIGLEMATVYDALGSAVTVVELADQLIPGCDPDLVKPLAERIAGRYAAILTETRVTALQAADAGLSVTFSSGETGIFDRVLVAVGRTPNGAGLGLEAAGVAVEGSGFVEVDGSQRTNVAHISAIGDVVGGPMLAHKATHEAKVAAEVCAGRDVVFDPRGIPSVAYTDPEIAWIGLTETEAKADGTPYELAVFPWAASGRALAVGGTSGRTKLLLDPATRRVLGAGIVGTGAGELIAEVALALEMGATAEDVGLTVHPHPTLSETVGLAAEVGEGTATDLPPPRRPR